MFGNIAPGAPRAARVEGLEPRRLFDGAEAAIIIIPDDPVASVAITTPLESDLGVPEIVVNIDPGQDIGIANKPPPKPRPDPKPIVIVKVADVSTATL